MLPQEFATSRIMDFVSWQCRSLVFDEDEDICTDDELAVVDECMAMYPNRINPRSCSLRLQEIVNVWDGPETIDVCTTYATGSEAMEHLHGYTHLGGATLLMEGCTSQWFGPDRIWRLERLRDVWADVLVRDIGEIGNRNDNSSLTISFPGLLRVRGNLRVEGSLADVILEFQALETISRDYSINSTTGYVECLLPRLQTIGGEVHVDKNAAMTELAMPAVNEIGGLSLSGQVGADISDHMADFANTSDITYPKNLVITVPSLHVVQNSIKIISTTSLKWVLFPHLKSVGGDLIAEGNSHLVELAFPDLTAINGDVINVRDNPRLSFFNLAQSQAKVNYCEAFSNGDLSGNRGLLNIRTLWFEKGNCEALQEDTRANICSSGYVLVRGEADGSRCDEDWRTNFTYILIMATGSIALASLLILYQSRQFVVFYAFPEFTQGKPIDPKLCGFSWHASMTSFLLSTVDKVSDIIFVSMA